ncbi:DNA mismatch repair protein MutS, partial [bacterium]|nr:DNA mismatch repair protein MutS [bacterium]
MTTEKLTPLMVQYFAVKEEHPDVLIFFQVGDFYELFFEDAKIASAFLAITLTKRGKCKGEDVPLCGVPLHAGNHYIAKLVRGGFRVAICDQMTKPQPGQVVERKVTKVFTPGTLTDSVLLDDKNPSYILSFQPGEKAWGLVFTELLTSQVFATSITAEEYRALGGELTRFFPDEVVLEDIARARGFRNFFSKSGYSVSLAHVERGEDIAGPNIPKALLEQQLSKDTLRILSDNPVIEATMELLYSYLKKNNEEALSQIKEVQFYRPEDFLVLDAATQKNLEIVRNNVDGGRKNTLISVADKACSPMGSRMIKKWLLRPLVQKKAIERRHAAVEKLTTSTELLSRISDFLKQVSDLERISGRIAFGRAMLQDYLGLKSTLRIIPEIVGEIEEHGRSEFLLSVSQGMLQVPELVEFLEASLNENREYGHNIKKGFDFELDRFRELVANGQNEVSKLEQREIERTGIGSLKIRYTDLFGYSIEVTKPNLKSVPDDFILQQSLSNKSRFVTPELKKLESEILTAREKIDEVESEVYERVKAEVAQHVTALRQTAQSLAQLDAIHGFARLAYDNCYVRPKISEEHAIEIEEGRHPVVEVALDGKFIANDTHLLDDSKLWIITGPNMGGKSTYLRQVALIAILSQAGSFVPASSAKLPVLDRVFTRIGSGDNLA